MARAFLSNCPESVDVLIAGGGYVGLSLALALKVGANRLDGGGGRSARTGASRQGWPGVRNCQRGAHHVDNLGRLAGLCRRGAADQPDDHHRFETRDPVRPVFLTFDGETKDGEPFAHMVPNGAMTKSLRASCLEEGVIIEAPQTVDDFHPEAGHVDITLGDKRQVTARLLVACDGVRSRLRDLAGIDTVGWMYGQSGIVCTVSHERDHEGIAYEHFLPAGPFASLPLPGKRSSIVWTEKTATADALVDGDEFTFMLELERRFGAQFGDLKLESRRVAFPLGLKLARSFIAPRLALAGDSAHGMHPIAGQGLNMGLRDVAALAEAVVDAARLGLDIGSDDVLERYQRWRRFDTAQMGVVTDVLNRLFSNDMAPVRMARSFGLGIVDRLPALKRYFIDEAAGISKDRPRLMSGKAI
jgi:2-octaprenyl-6-methoxyphenol hydroxylase